MTDKSKDFPKELVSPVANIHSTLKDLDEILKTGQEVPLQDLIEKNNLNSTEKAKLDCVSAFALNTLVWTWIRSKGENPKEVGVKFELDRAKQAMLRLKQIQDKKKRNPVDSQAAKRLVKGSLWVPKDDKKRSKETDEEDSSSSKKKSKT